LEHRKSKEVFGIGVRNYSVSHWGV